jgi:hypothetical protein
LGGLDNRCLIWLDAVMLGPYPSAVEQAMLVTYASLNERQRRLYAANEALKLGRGGITYVAQLFDCHRKTVQRGWAELQTGASSLPPHRARKKGAAAVAACRSGPVWTRRS